MRKITPAERAFFLLVLAAFLAGLALLAASAQACELIEEDNVRLTKKHNALATALQQLEANLVLMETTCQNEQKLISARGAKAATAESCVALKENAAMNRELTQSSRKCSEQISALEKNINLFTAEHMQPFEEGMRGVVEVDKMARQALPHCGRQFKKASEIQKAAEGTLARSHATLLKSRDDIGRFTKLGDTTQLFGAKTQAAVDRCGFAEPATTMLAGVKGGRQDAAAGGGSAGEKVGGQHENGESDITGDLRRAQLASGNAGSVKRGGSASRISGRETFLPSEELAKGPAGKGAELLGAYAQPVVPGGIEGKGLRVPLTLAETRDEKGIGEMIRLVNEAHSNKDVAKVAGAEGTRAPASETAPVPVAQGMWAEAGPATPQPQSAGDSAAAQGTGVKLITLSDSPAIEKDTLFKRVTFQHRKWEFLGPVQSSVAGTP